MDGRDPIRRLNIVREKLILIVANHAQQHDAGLSCCWCSVGKEYQEAVAIVERLDGRPIQ